MVDWTQFFSPSTWGSFAPPPSDGTDLPSPDELGSAKLRRAPVMTAWPQRTGPTVPEHILNSMQESGRILTSPPVAAPPGSYNDDAGFISQGEAKPDAWQAFVADQKSRHDFGPSVATGLIGGGAPGIERGAAGIAGGRLNLLNNADAYRAAGINRANRGLPSGQAAEGWTAKAAPVPAKGTPERSLQEFKAPWENARDQAVADYQYAANPNLSAADRAYMESPGFVLGSGATDKKLGAANIATQAEHAAAAQPPGIRAYHGSPHDFERFDLSKIGTGEGAQAYGHGLYFAENPTVAQEYRRSLAPRADSPHQWLSDAIREAGEGGAADWLQSQHKQLAGHGFGNDLEAASIRDALAMLHSGEKPSPKGRMYEVNINANPEHFLDWDKPLSEQPEVQKVLGSAGLRSAGPGRPLDVGGLHEFPPTGTGTSILDAFAKRKGEGYVPKHMRGDTGRDLHGFLRTHAYESGISSTYGGEATSASSALRQAGIPGIKYLDQGSRQPKTLFNGQPIPSDNPTARLAAEKLDLHGSPDKAIASLESDATQGHPYIRQSSADAAALLKSGSVARHTAQGTSNYVLFDDKLVDILKKYGIIGMGGGAAPFAMGGRQTQPQL